MDFWLCELRTPELLIAVSERWPSSSARLSERRPLLSVAVAGGEQQLAAALLAEELAERQADELYWRPLRAELQRLRHAGSEERP